MGQSWRKYSKTRLFFQSFIEKSVCHDCFWYDEDLERIYQKWKILTLVHIFAYNSKSILPERASFSHAGIQMIYFFLLDGDIMVLWSYIQMSSSEGLPWMRWVMKMMMSGEKTRNVREEKGKRIQEYRIV